MKYADYIRCISSFDVCVVAIWRMAERWHGGGTTAMELSYHKYKYKLVLFRGARNRRSTESQWDVWQQQGNISLAWPWHLFVFGGPGWKDLLLGLNQLRNHVWRIVNIKYFMNFSPLRLVNKQNLHCRQNQYEVGGWRQAVAHLILENQNQISIYIIRGT